MCLKLAMVSSSALCSFKVPASSRTPCVPVPNSARAASAAALILGVTDQAQVAVRGKHQHFAPMRPHARAAAQLLDRLVVKVEVLFLQAFHTLAHGAARALILSSTLAVPAMCTPLPG